MDVVVRQYMDAVRRLEESDTKLVDKSEWNRRLSICISCEKYEQYNEGPVFKCTQCGCPGFKFMVEDSKCPLRKPKWR